MREFERAIKPRPHLTSFMFINSATNKFMVIELSPDSLSRVMKNRRARFLEGEDMATYSSLLDKDIERSEVA
ncbi:hypothetical protein NIES593_10215 [Hydrococcus rivularis NIES-593]|uniref:Uncharacterized protein n=1 Tax=Hydrococcus rivularis NIES-593 TaxID=1921803 RepID=A0A1U7HHZ1_9CYAN|nr:hypothetical protein NIES593_10215 [Hydrococcus rivularis NIES-593]